MSNFTDGKHVWLEGVTAFVYSFDFATEHRDLLWDALIKLRQALQGTVRSREFLEEDYTPMVWPIGPRGRCEACSL
jgi:hypothetical protein